MTDDVQTLIARCREFEIPDDAPVFRTNEQLATHLDSSEGLRSAEIGHSRNGAPLFGFEFGGGDERVSVIAGCHADEPVGPMTAQYLPAALVTHFPELLLRYTFCVVPQMNPDGAERNRAWFSQPVEFETYLREAQRELPGDDIEFGFGDRTATRPECRAAQEFLRPRGPFRAHFSLHGMAWAEGAWCLIHPEWAERSLAFRTAYDEVCRSLDVPLHDVERHGEKGFRRIARGYSTTPNSVAMREFFLERDDEAMAQKFQPSSMEWIRSLGGDPVCIVTELPLFQFGLRSASLDDPVSAKFSDALGSGCSAPQLWEDFALETFPIELHMRLQISAIVLALSLLRL